MTYYAPRTEEVEVVRFPVAVWWAIGYSLFIYVSLNLIAVWAVTPDMMVSAVVYLAAGLLLRLQSDRASPATAALLGLVLGVGYLARRPCSHWDWC